MRLPDPIANTTTEAYLAYKAGVLAKGDLKPKLYDPYIHLDAWLAYWCGLTNTYPVKNVGKNLFNKNIPNVVTGTVDVSGYNAGGNNKSFWIKCKGDTTYTIQKRNDGDYNRFVVGATDTFPVQGTPIFGRIQDYNASSITITTDSSAEYIVCTFYRNQETVLTEQELIDSIQVEEGSTATAYEPYTGEPEMLTDEEAYIAYLSGVTNTYPEEFRDPADIRVAAYLRYLISARWGRPEYPVTNEELYLSMLKTQYIPSGDPSSDIEIDGTAKAPFVDVKMYGDTAQQTYSGAQIVKEQGFATPASNTDFWIITNATQSDISSDGFSTFTFSGTGFKNFFIRKSGSDIKASTTYTVIVELDKVTDLPFITITQGNANSDSFPDFTVISLPDGAHMTSSGNATHGAVTMTAGNGGNIVLLGTTRDELKTQTLRFFTSGTSTDGKKIRARVSIIEGDHTSDWQNYSGDNWQPYVGGTPSPNPDYPQPIQTVTGEQTIEVVGKNLFNQGAYTSSSIRGASVTFNQDKIAVSGAVDSTRYPSWIMYADGSTATSDWWATASLVNTSKGQFTDSGTYTISIEADGNIGSIATAFEFIVGYMDGTVSPNQYVDQTTKKATFTTSKPINYISFGFRPSVSYDATFTIQLEAGDTATSFAPYNKQTYPLDLGKNLFDVDNANIMDRYYFDESLEIAYAPLNPRNLLVWVACQPSTTYSITVGSRTNISQIQVGEAETKPAEGVTVSALGSVGSSLKLENITTSNQAHYLVIRLQTLISYAAMDCFDSVFGTAQIEVGSTATAFAPYFTPIELCKLGDYQDKIYKNLADNKWYLHKEVGKAVYSSSDFTLANSDQYTNVRYAQFAKQEDNIQYGNYEHSTIVNYFTAARNMGGMPSGGWDTFNAEGEVYNNAMRTAWWCSFAKTTSLDTIESKLDGMAAYYALATPTDTTITDQTLIAQLDALVNGGAEDGTTYIKVNATDPNLPGLLYVEAPKYD